MRFPDSQSISVFETMITDVSLSVFLFFFVDFSSISFEIGIAAM